MASDASRSPKPAERSAAARTRQECLAGSGASPSLRRLARVPSDPTETSAAIALDGREYWDVSSVLQDIGTRSVVYKPISTDAQQLFYVPFFVPKGKDGKLDVAVQPADKVEQIARFIRNEEAAHPIDTRRSGRPLERENLECPGAGYSPVPKLSRH